MVCEGRGSWVRRKLFYVYSGIEKILVMIQQRERLSERGANGRYYVIARGCLEKLA